jgi:hypothetical protein
MKPSVVTETTFPLSTEILWRHSPITLLMKAVVHEANIGFDKSVPFTLNIFPVRASKAFLFDTPLTTFP